MIILYHAVMMSVDVKKLDTVPGHGFLSSFLERNIGALSILKKLFINHEFF